MNMKRSVLKWELVGIVVISILGSIMHFVFEWSGELELVGILGAVNESVWEHLKLAFWPALFYGLFEHRYFVKLTQNFVFAKACGMYTMPLVIVVIFYLYTALVGHEILAVDIVTFWLAVALGQLTSYKIMTSRSLPEYVDRLGLILIVLLALAFCVFTFYPPQLPPFRDAVTGSYGIFE